MKLLWESGPRARVVVTLSMGKLLRPKTGRPSGGALEIREAQRLAWQNKIAKEFNTSDVPLEFMLLHSEVAESFQAWRRGSPISARNWPV